MMSPVASLHGRRFGYTIPGFKDKGDSLALTSNGGAEDFQKSEIRKSSRTNREENRKVDVKFLRSKNGEEVPDKQDVCRWAQNTGTTKYF